MHSFFVATFLLTSLAGAQNLRQLNEVATKPGSSSATAAAGIADKKDTAHKKRQQLTAYFQDRRSQLQVIATTVTDSGQIIDWIDPTNLLPEGSTRAMPSPPPAPETSNTTTTDNIAAADSMFELRQQPHAMGPEGTVPVRRGDTIVNSMKDDDLPSSVEDYLSKYGNKKDIPKGRLRHHHGSTKDAHKRNTTHRKLQSSEYQHKYVATGEEVSNFGGEAYINTWDPYVWKTGEFSLAQVAVTAGSPLQSVECGWQVFPGLYDDSYPHLFTFFTTNGYASQTNNVGGYNLDVSGFVQVSTTIFPGARLTGLISLSSYGGSQYSMQVKVQLYQGNWWVWVINEWIGYYPATLYSNEADGLLTGATDIDWYGEIVDVTDGKPTQTWMGSGKFAAKGFGYAAYMRNILTYRNDCNCVADYSPDYFTITNSKCYSYAFNNNSTTWGSSFYFGGPGAYKNRKCRPE